MKKIFTIFLLALVAVATSACTPNDNGEEAVEIKIGMVNWAEGVAMSNLAKVIAEDELGYEITLTTVSPGPIYASISEGDYDYFLDAWLPSLHSDYMDEFGDTIVEVGTNFEGTLVGLVVPAYVQIDSITELNAAADDFDGEITGIGSGAGIMSTTETAIDVYNLTNMELTVSSEAAMLAALSDAIDNEEPIVVTGWEPHWKFGAYDLKFLEDLEGVYGDPEQIKTISRVGAADDFPAFNTFIANFSMTSAQLNGLMADINDSSDDAIDVARTWAEENDDLVDEWLEGIN